MTEGLEDSPSNEKARVLLEKRKSIAPPSKIKRKEPHKKSKAHKRTRSFQHKTQYWPVKKTFKPKIDEHAVIRIRNQKFRENLRVAPRCVKIN